MPVEMLPLCAPKDVRSLTNVAENYKGMDAVIQQFITTASAEVRSFCRRTFVIQPRVEYFASPDGYANSTTYKMIENPFVDGEPVAVDYGFAGNFSLNNVQPIPDGYVQIDPDRGEIMLVDGFYQYARKGIRVSYTAGYPAIQVDGFECLDVPDDLRKATAMQCAFLLSKAKAGALGKTSLAQNSGITENYDRGGLTGLIREASGAILHYRRTLVGRT